MGQFADFDLLHYIFKRICLVNILKFVSANAEIHIISESVFIDCYDFSC